MPKCHSHVNTSKIAVTTNLSLNLFIAVEIQTGNIGAREGSTDNKGPLPASNQSERLFFLIILQKWSVSSFASADTYRAIFLVIQTAPVGYFFVFDHKNLI